MSDYCRRQTQTSQKVIFSIKKKNTKENREKNKTKKVKTKATVFLSLLAFVLDVRPGFCFLPGTGLVLGQAYGTIPERSERTSKKRIKKRRKEKKRCDSSDPYEPCRCSQRPQRAGPMTRGHAGPRIYPFFCSRFLLTCCFLTQILFMSWI